MTSPSKSYCYGIHFGFLEKIVDVVLYRDLEEEINMECAQGMSNIEMTALF